MSLPVSAKHLVEVIHYWLEKRPTQEVLRFYPQGEGEYQSLSFAELDLRCRAIASHLQAYQGQRAVLLFNSSLEFLESLLACFYAGVIAVPAYPPRKNHHLKRLSALIDDCQPQLIISASVISERAKPLFEQALDNNLHGLQWLIYENVRSQDSQHYQPFDPDENQLAFLQYTSGSTGKPKGVMISHRNLMSNIRMAHQAFALPDNARCISWLPLFHDMGLIGSVMAPLYWGAGSVIMPPAAFLQKPLRWLKLLSEFGQYSPVGCTAPNFSYQLCVDSVSDEEAKALDLSHWIFALSGAEPIRLSTLTAFAEKFAISGFNAQALVPAYGMAECTVLSTCKTANTAIISQTFNQQALTQNQLVLEDNGLALVSSGSTCYPQQLRIVDAESFSVLPDGQVGEIWLQGDHIGQGYFHNRVLSEQVFQAYSQDGQGPFLRTGDLGALIDGQLFVTGRIKDLIIIRGQNHYPQDIELTAMQAAAGLHPEHTAAFTVEQNGQEKLVIVQEVERGAQKAFDAQSAGKAIANAIAREHGIETEAVAFIRFASMAKTSSGKIQRHACKQAYQQQQLSLLALWQAAEPGIALPQKADKALSEMSQSELEQWLIQWLAAKSKQEPEAITASDALDGLGLDSIDMVQLSGELESWLGRPIEHHLIYQQATVQALAATMLELAAKSPADNSLQGEVEGVI